VVSTEVLVVPAVPYQMNAGLVPPVLYQPVM
jgi:hypothetical protein